MSRELGSTLVTSRSPMRMRPPLTSSRPASMRRDVDLPHPEGPTRTRNSPSAMSMLSLSTLGTGLPGYCRVASSKVTVAIFRTPSPAGTCRTIRCKGCNVPEHVLGDPRIIAHIGHPHQGRTDGGHLDRRSHIRWQTNVAHHLSQD